MNCVVVFLVVSSLETQFQAPSGTARSFGQVAQTVTLIGRFRSRAQRRRVAFGQCFVEPVVRRSSHGSRYWSILEEENSEFLDRLGYYQKGTRSCMLKADYQTGPVARRSSGWACIRAAAVKSPGIAVNVPQTDDKKSPLLAVSDITNGKKSPTLAVSGVADGQKSPTQAVSGTRDGKKSPLLSPRPSDVGLSQDAVVENVALNIPARFMSRRSTIAFPPQMVLCPQAEPASDVQHEIPTIEISSDKRDWVLRQHSEHSGFEWYKSSSFSSSSTTDDMSSPSSTDSYIQRLEEIRSSRRASAVDVDSDRLFVRVSSDAGSTVSSQTLIEGNGSFETTGPELSDPSKVSDTQLHRLPEEQRQLQHDSLDIEEVSRIDTTHW